MPWYLHIVVLTVAAVALLLLQSMYRRPEARAEAFLISLLLCSAALWVPDMAVVWLLSEVLIIILRAADVRVFSASLMGVATVLLYACICGYMWPASAALTEAVSAWQGALVRTFCWRQMPLWQLIVSGVVFVLGIVLLLGHFQRYQTANVRVQTPLLISTFWWHVGLLSAFFPAASGHSLFALLAGGTIYLLVLYLVTYGWPRIRLGGWASRNPSRRAYSRRSRRR